MMVDPKGEEQFNEESEIEDGEIDPEEVRENDPFVQSRVLHRSGGKGT